MKSKKVFSKVFPVYMTREMLYEIDKAAKQSSLSKSEVVRRILKDYFKERKKEFDPIEGDSGPEHQIP